jgi:hypothetical protein
MANNKNKLKQKAISRKGTGTKLNKNKQDGGVNSVKKQITKER